MTDEDHSPAKRAEAAMSAIWDELDDLSQSAMYGTVSRLTQHIDELIQARIEQALHGCSKEPPNG